MQPGKQSLYGKKKNGIFTTLLMEELPYQFFESSDKADYIFKSEGKRAIIKVVQFRKINIDEESYINLALGDADDETGKPDFKVISNNGDMRRVIATVADIISDFFTYHPDATIYITGATQGRNLFYQKLVRDYYELISLKYVIEGVKHGQRAPFQGNGQYDYILIQLK